MRNANTEMVRDFCGKVKTLMMHREEFPLRLENGKAFQQTGKVGEFQTNVIHYL